MAGVLRYNFSAGKTDDGCNNEVSPISSAEGANGEWRPRRSIPILAAGDEHVLVCPRRSAMTTRSFCTLAAAIFALIALLQLIRIVMGWSVTLNGVDVPFWASWIAVIVAGALSFVGFRAAMRG